MILFYDIPCTYFYFHLPAITVETHIYSLTFAHIISTHFRCLSKSKPTEIACNYTLLKLSSRLEQPQFTCKKSIVI